MIFLKEPQINTATYKAAMEKKVDTVKTGDDATDELTAGIMAAVNQYMMRLAERQIILAFEQAQKEVDDLHQRTREGIETARLAGEQIGKAKGQGQTMKSEAPIKARIKQLSKDFDGSMSDKEVMEAVKGMTYKVQGKNGKEITRTVKTLARNTYYKYKAEMKASGGEQ